MKLYIYANLLAQTFEASTINYWTTDKEQSTGLYISDWNSYQLLDVVELQPPTNFDFTTGKITALENKLEKDLADSHVRQNNLREQIQELKCIGHDPVPSAFPDDDIPY